MSGLTLFVMTCPSRWLTQVWARARLLCSTSFPLKVVLTGNPLITLVQMLGTDIVLFPW